MAACQVRRRADPEGFPSLSRSPRRGRRRRGRTGVILSRRSWAAGCTLPPAVRLRAGERCRRKSWSRSLSSTEFESLSYVTPRDNQRRCRASAPTILGADRSSRSLANFESCVAPSRKDARCRLRASARSAGEPLPVRPIVPALAPVRSADAPSCGQRQREAWRRRSLGVLRVWPIPQLSNTPIMGVFSPCFVVVGLVMVALKSDQHARSNHQSQQLLFTANRVSALSSRRCHNVRFPRRDARAPARAANPLRFLRQPNH